MAKAVNSDPHSDNNPTEPIRPPTGTIVTRPETLGFGAYGDQRRQEIYNDDPTVADPNYASYAPGGRGGLGGPQVPPTGATTGSYKRTFFFIEHSDQGIRVSIQATTKAFIIGLLLILALANLPSFGNTVQLLIKSILTGQ